MTTIAHLSDTHLDASPHRTRRLERAVAELQLLPHLDALVITGDLADNGLRQEYTAFFAALPVGIPTIVMTGNHDKRSALAPFLGAEPSEEPINGTLSVAGGTIVALDSLIPGDDAGRLDACTLAFAQEAIDAADGWVLLAMHHPSVPVGHPVMDQYGLLNGDELAELIAANPTVVGCLTGHVHSALATTFAGRPMLGAPGIVSTMRIGGQSDPIADENASPGFAIHTVSDGGHISTLFRYLSPQ